MKSIRKLYPALCLLLLSGLAAQGSAAGPNFDTCTSVATVGAGPNACQQYLLSVLGDGCVFATVKYTAVPSTDPHFVPQYTAACGAAAELLRGAETSVNNQNFFDNFGCGGTSSITQTSGFQSCHGTNVFLTNFSNATETVCLLADGFQRAAFDNASCPVPKAGQP